MRKALIFIFFIFLTQAASAQELYLIAEPASNVPKGALGVRFFGEGYSESGLFRSLSGLKMMYGVTPKLSVYASATFSDYHEKTLPFDFITHNHSGVPQKDSTATPQQGVPYPYIFNSIDLYAKYRFVTVDGANTHFRVAAYAEGSYVAVPSHEAEPDLLVHTSGFGAGLIATYLKQHFAVSLTSGFIIPADYKGDTHDNYGGVYPTTIQYGKAVNYSLSFGYLLFPQQYKNYQQTNWNIYCEFTGKSYGAAKATEQYGTFSGALVYSLPITTPILKAGSYLEMAPGIQCIISSAYRIDFSVDFPIISRSYDHLYPLYLAGVQRYFYFHKRTS